jgi:alpha,alpha-trehalase
LYVQDEGPSSYKPAFLVHLERTKNQILDQEDTDQNNQITVEDSGPKYLQLSTANSQGLNSRSISGHYMISNLLQELALAQDRPASRQIVIEEERLKENPVVRLCKIVSGVFWPNLRRSIDLEGLRVIVQDAKNRGKDQTARIYIPSSDVFAAEYYRRVAKAAESDFHLEICILPESLDEAFVQSINEHPGILSLQLHLRNRLGRWENVPEGDIEAVPTDLSAVRGLPFIVPGGRFNEMYGWDSYFSVLGLLKSVEESEWCKSEHLFMAKSMVDNFVYELLHYGKILNANRSYYLLRSQPPFLTDMAWKVYLELCKFVADSSRITGAAVEEELLSEAPNDWLRRVCQAAIFEYKGVWLSEPRFIAETGLSRYYGAGRGLPPETEESHFNAVLKRFSEAAGCTDPPAIAKLYNSGQFKSEELGKEKGCLFKTYLFLKIHDMFYYVHVHTYIHR